MQEASPSTDDPPQSKGLLGRIARNGAALFAVGSAFLAAALPAAEFVKGIYELRAKAQEHADQIELEFLRLITNAATQPPDRRRILAVLSAEKSNLSLHRWAREEARLYDEQVAQAEALYHKRQQAAQDVDARRRAYQIASIDLATRHQEMEQLIQEKAEPSRQRTLLAEMDQLQQRVELLQSEYTVSATLVTAVAPAAITANPPTSDDHASAAGILTTGVMLRSPTACNDILAVDFKGRAASLTGSEFKEVAASLSVEPGILYAIAVVASSGYGFSDKRPRVLFERHIFHRLTNGKYDADYPDVSQPSAGGYGPSGSRQYERIKQAMGLDCVAALKATSWGIFQILGEDSNRSGFKYVDDFVKAMMESEKSQFDALAGFLRSDKAMLNSLQRKDWVAFARRYFGPSYSANNYDGLFARAYADFQTRQDAVSSQTGADEQRRTIQAQLKELRYYDGAVDGRLSDDLFWAVRNFQAEHGMAADGDVGSFTKARIAACAAGTSACR